MGYYPIFGRCHYLNRVNFDFKVKLLGDVKPKLLEYVIIARELGLLSCLGCQIIDIG